MVGRTAQRSENSSSLASREQPRESILRRLFDLTSADQECTQGIEVRAPAVGV